LNHLFWIWSSSLNRGYTTWYLSMLLVNCFKIKKYSSVSTYVNDYFFSWSVSYQLLKWKEHSLRTHLFRRQTWKYKIFLHKHLSCHIQYYHTCICAVLSSKQFSLTRRYMLSETENKGWKKQRISDGVNISNQINSIIIWYNIQTFKQILE
jgi:hypothetical protein